MLDLELLRRDTPGCLDKVFLDSAGSSLPPRPVLSTVVGHLRREAEVGGYLAAAERAEDLAAVKASIATLIGASAATGDVTAASTGSIALVDSATRAWTDFFCAVPLHAGDRILISQVEYASNAIAALHRARAAGARVEVIPSDPLGRIDLEALARMLDEQVRLVSLVHAPTNGGLVNPVREVVDLVHGHGGLVLLDACQSVGQLPIDVGDYGVDATSATGRKWLRGPRGTGFLYVRPELLNRLEPASLDLHGARWTGVHEYRTAADASRFEFWECDVAARLGLGAAVDYLLDLGVEEVAAAVSDRAEHLRDGLSSIPGATVRDLGECRSGIVSFTVEGWDCDRLRRALGAQGITVTASLRGSTLLDMSARNLESVVRASPHYFVSPADLDRFLAAVRELAGR